MKLNYRMSTPEDKTELVELWTNEAEWDRIDEKVWEHRFGNAEIALAVDDSTGRIVGQIVFIPTTVVIDGREIKGRRPFATFLIKEARSFQTLNPLSHPMFRMFQLAIASFREKGVGLIHMLPAPMWARMLQLAPEFRIAKFPLWSIKLPLAEPFEPANGCRAVEAEPGDPRLDELWEKAARLYRCTTVRNSPVLVWKTSHHKYYYLGVERSGELVGFVSSRFKAQDRQWLICDLIAADHEALETTIKAVCHQAAEFKAQNPGEPLEKVAILATDMILPIVQEAGFYKDSYNFIFVVQRLDESLKMEEIAPARWYIAAND